MSHRSHTKGDEPGKVRLGSGELQEPGKDRDFARVLFFQTIHQTQPGVLADLLASDEAAIEAWARRYHLTLDGIVPDWVAKTAQRTIRRAGRPENSHLTLELGFSLAHLMTSWRLPAAECRVSLAHNSPWNPTGFPPESKAAARQRILEELAALVDAELDRIDQTARAGGWTADNPRRTAAHFETLARYQVGGEDLKEIGGERRTWNAIARAADEVGLSLRPSTSKKGRPRYSCPR